MRSVFRWRKSSKKLKRIEDGICNQNMNRRRRAVDPCQCNQLKTPDFPGFLTVAGAALFFDVIQSRFGKALDDFGALFQLGVFFFAESGVEFVMNAAAADHAGHRHADVVDAFDFVMKGRDVQHRVFITVNRLANAAQGPGNTEGGGTFAVDDFVSGVADVVVNVVFDFFG